jgi:hypothetical protein
MSAPARYWTCGGDIIAAPRHNVSQSDAEALLELHVEEARAAADAGDALAMQSASNHALELAKALIRARRWRRAAGPLCWT